jgi:transposase
MEAPMKLAYFIGLDTHGSFCEMAVVTRNGNLVQRGKCNTTISALREMLDKVPTPRHLVFEEGPLANWLYRNLNDHVESLTVAEPRRNRLISCEGDKDDPVDAEKLAQLLRGGFVKVVHQTATLDETVFKQLVAQYHRRVRRRVAAGQQITGLLKQHGVMARAKHFDTTEDRVELLTQLPSQRLLLEMVRASWKEYDAVQAQEDAWRKRLLREAKKDETVVRFTELPGIGWVRAATLRVYLDTPWRFRSVKALWKYLGIGLDRRHSGKGPELLGVPKQTNRLLKSTILGAARSAIAQGENPFADQYRRWISRGLSAKMAKRNVARHLSATLWGLWKSGTVYHPEWVGVNLAATQGIETS